MIRFENAIEEYLEFIKLKKKPQSYRSIKSRLINYILPYFKGKNINELKAIDYLKWQQNINKFNFRYKYKRTIHYSFVSLLNFCITFYDLDVNIASKVGNFKNINEIEKEINIWTIDDFNKFIKIVDEKVYKILFDFLFFTGCRLGEALALNFNDINDNNIFINKTISKEFYNGKRVITLPKTKKSIRKIDIDDILVSEIKELKNYYNDHCNDYNNNFFIFGGRKALSPTTIERKKNYYCELANVKQIRIHDFRHSHISLLISNNAPIKGVSERVGHSNTSITLNIYTHSNEEDKKRVLSTLNSLRLN